MLDPSFIPDHDGVQIHHNFRNSSPKNDISEPMLFLLCKHSWNLPGTNLLVLKLNRNNVIKLKIVKIEGKPHAVHQLV